jgi:hypothetical protein
MRNTAKKTSALLLCLLLTFSAISCGNSADTPAGNESDTQDIITTAEETTQPELTDGLPNTDFGGYEFRIASCNFYNKELATYLAYDELTGNPVNDELYNSKLYIENRFNVEISWIACGDTTAVMNAVKNSVTAGDDAFDITIGHDTNTGTLAQNGFLYDMRKVEQFDFEQPWWPSNTCDNLQVCGKLYVASNYMSYCGLHWTRVLCVNKTIAENYGREIPYNTVREGKWTLDSMFEFIADTTEDLDGNGKITAADQVGYVSGGQTNYCLQEALGCSVYKADSDGVPMLEINLDRLVTMVEKLNWLYKTSELYLSNGDFGSDVFKNNLALLAYTLIGDAYDFFRESEVIYGFLPSPKLDEVQENYINYCTDVPWAIPKTAARMDIVGTICEALSCYNYKNVLPAYYEVAIKNRIADSPDDAEMLQLIADTRTIGFAYFYGMSFNNIISDVVGTTKEISSYLEKGEKSARKKLEKLVTTFEDME